MKKWTRPGKIEWLSFYTGMPLICLLLNGLLFGRSGFNDYRVWVYSFPLIFAQGFISWYLHIAVMHWLRRRFPHISQTSLRLTLLAFAHIFLISATYISLFYAYDAVHFLGYELNTSRLGIALCSGVALTMIATTLWEADYTLKQWK